MTDEEEPTDDSGSLPEWEITDRKRGILTQFDRELIFGGKDLSGQELRNARYRIRQRLIESLNDLAVISIRLDEEELKKTFEDDRSPLRSNLTSHFIKFAYLSVLLDDDVTNNIDEFEDQIEQTIFDYHNDKVDLDENPEVRYSTEANIELQREKVDLDALEHRIIRGEATPAEAMAYYNQTVKQEGRTARSEAMDIVAEEIFDED